MSSKKGWGSTPLLATRYPRIAFTAPGRSTTPYGSNWYELKITFD